jgi:CheY-like chemotaxis protein
MRPSAVLLDMNLPNVDGLGFLDRLPREVRGQLPPVIAMSADPEFAGPALAKGAVSFLHKPMAMDVLLSVMVAALAGRPRDEELQVINLLRVRDRLKSDDRIRDQILDESRIEEPEFRRCLKNLLGWLAGYFGSPMTFVNLLRHDEVTLFENVGAPAEFGPRTRMACESTYCANLIRSNESLVIHDAQIHEVYRHHPAARLGIRFYVSVPLRTPAQASLGTLCLESTKPEKFDAEDLPALACLADEVGREIFLSVRNKEMKWDFFSDPEFLQVEAFAVFKKASIARWRPAREPLEGLSLKSRTTDPSLRDTLVQWLRKLPNRAGVAFSEIRGIGVFSGYGPKRALDALVESLDKDKVEIIQVALAGSSAGKEGQTG